MARGYEVLEMLIPEGGWTIYGDDFEGIIFDGKLPITKKQFTDGFAKVDAFKAEKDATKATAKAALLERLGITENEFRSLLG